MSDKGKLIFFDIDGTIWDERMEIPESTARSIALLKENGHRAFLCSGRARSNIRSGKLLEIGFDGIIAACGGHIELGGELLYEKLLPQELVERLIRSLRECHMPAVLEGPEYHWIDEEGIRVDPYVGYLFEELGDRARPLRGYKDDICINKFSANILEDTDYPRIRREFGDEFVFLEHNARVVECVPRGISKATGIQWICDCLGVRRSDTYGIGDSVNDLDMLRFVGHSISMGNGSPEAKAAAEYVTSDIHDDGICHAMLHYGLINE